MHRTLPWIAFLCCLFGLVGLCGLFASVAPSIPLERALRRGAVLDQALAAPDPAALERLRPDLGSLAATVIEGAGPLPQRIAAARATVADEQRREAASVAYRVRLLLVCMTVLAAGLGSGILLLAQRNRADAPERGAAGTGHGTA
jgi:hypothetical protein